MPTTLRDHIHQVDKKLRTRLRIYILISFILVMVIVVNVFRGDLHPGYAVLAVVAGMGIGIFSSRMFRTSWDSVNEKVISRLDAYGVIILIAYIIVELNRDKIVGYFTHDFQVTAIGFAALAGIMIGRVVGARGSILQVLKEQEVFSVD